MDVDASTGERKRKARAVDVGLSPYPITAGAAVWLGLGGQLLLRLGPVGLEAGDALDFWRVEEVDPPDLLRLRAEMKVPGRAWLQFEALPEDNGTRLVQTAIFEPIGLGGQLYWYLLYPIHRIMFSGMVRRVAALAEKGNGA